jgi:hypothetical protein
VKSSRSAAAKSTTYQKRPDGFELLSEKCSSCDKSASEIKKAWKEGTGKNDNEKRRKRLEELKSLGFSGIVVNK